MIDLDPDDRQSNLRLCLFSVDGKMPIQIHNYKNLPWRQFIKKKTLLLRELLNYVQCVFPEHVFK